MSKKLWSALDVTAVWPPLPYADWQESKETLHCFTQIMGKVRMALAPKQNHWWHVTLYLSPRGLTTRAIPYGHRSVELHLDLLDHVLLITTSEGNTQTVALTACVSVADFYHQTMAALRQLDIAVMINPKPYELARTTPFDQDTAACVYDPSAVTRFWRILLAANNLLEEVRAGYSGKSSPVHFFWHSFDLAVTRFSGRPAPLWPGMSQVALEAYSHEVISFGFWPGDANTPAPAFYAYTAPAPDGLTEQPLQPASAFWLKEPNTMALLPYDALRQSVNPRQTVLDFCHSAYQAGVSLTGGDAVWGG
jgi:Family of unknown function (DUF5996)